MKKIFGALMIAVCIGMAMPAQAPLGQILAFLP